MALPTLCAVHMGVCMRLTSERLVLRHLSLSMGLASVGRPTQDTPGQSSGSGPVSLVSFGGNWKFKPFLVAVDPRLAKTNAKRENFPKILENNRGTVEKGPKRGRK